MKNKSEAKPTAFLPYKGGQRVSKTRVNFLRQLFVKTASIRVHQEFTETSPDFEELSLETLRQLFGAASVVLERINPKKCRQYDSEMSVIFIPFPRIAEYTRNTLIQFDINSSYLYVVVLKKLCL